MGGIITQVGTLVAFRRLFPAAVQRHFIQSIGPGRHGLCFQRLLRETRRHFRRQHAYQIFLERDLPHLSLGAQFQHGFPIVFPPGLLLRQHRL